MKIGIDAKWFFEGPPSGKVVIQNLVKQMVKLNEEHELYFFLDHAAENEKFPYEGANINKVYVWANNNLLSNLLFLPQCARRLKLDVVVFQNFSSFNGSYKKIAYIHDVLFLSNPEFYTLKERLYFSPLKFLTKRSDSVCTVSLEEKKRILLYGYKSKPSDIDVVYHGVDEIFKPIEKYEKSYLETIKSKYKLPNLFVLFVGRLNTRKNIYNLLRAVPYLKNKNIPIVIVGSKDWKMFDYEKLIDELKIKDRLIFTGFVQGLELACIYSLARVFCFPSYAESFGLPALEAMASGVPIVVSDRTSLPEICGDSGTYINPDKPEEIANKIDLLIDDKKLWNEKRLLGIERAKFFTWEKSAQSLLKSINKIVSK